jgi:hypothetical protein
VRTRVECSRFIFSMGYVVSISCMEVCSQREKDATFVLKMEGKVKSFPLNSKGLCSMYSTVRLIGLHGIICI